MSGMTPEEAVEAKGDWYCKNCGYLSASRVTSSETCDECHIPVQWHDASEQNVIDGLIAQNNKLKSELAELAELKRQIKPVVKVDLMAEDLGLTMENIKWKFDLYVRDTLIHNGRFEFIEKQHAREAGEYMAKEIGFLPGQIEVEG
jgi:hypothetical protein